MIAAVVVTHSASKAVVDACIASLRAAGGIDRIVLVDNGSEAHVRPSDIDTLRVVNRGYGAAANVGFRAAMASGATAVALLNDDVIVRPGWIEPLARALAEDGVGVAQPKLLLADDPTRVNSLGVVLDRFGAGSDIGDGTLDVTVGAPSPLAYFTGGAALFGADFLDATGGFDERFFLYYEDVDLAEHGRQLGWSYRLVPASVVEHERSASTSADPLRTRFLQERNRLWNAFRHADAATTARALWLSIRRLRHQPRGLHGKALVTGVAGAPSAWWRRIRHSNRVKNQNDQTTNGSAASGSMS